MAYFSNATEGAILDAQCPNCPGGPQCPVALVQLIYNYDQVTAGNEKLREAISLLISDDGMCNMRASIIDNARQIVGPA